MTYLTRCLCLKSGFLEILCISQRVVNDSGLEMKVYKHGNSIVIGVINHSKTRFSPQMDLSPIASRPDKIKILYCKGKVQNEEFQLRGTKVKFILDFEEAIFLELITSADRPFVGPN